MSSNKQTNTLNYKTQIKLSVIVSVYNVKLYLNECLKSLAEQSTHDVEFIIVDDGSTDGSSNICDKWGLYDKRFIIIHHYENKGLFLARETGILKSRGERIIFLDGDDFLVKDAIQNIFLLINKCDADIIQFSSIPFNAKNKYQYKNVAKYLYNDNKIINDNTNIARALFIDKTIKWTLWNKIYNSKLLKKSCIGFCNYKCIAAEDIYRMFLISFYSKTFYSYKTKPLYFYRLNTGISTKKATLYTFNSYMQHTKIVSNIYSFLQQEHASPEWYDFLNSVKTHLYSELIYIMSTLPKEEFYCAFQLFKKEYDIIYCIKWLEMYFLQKQNELATAYAISQKNKIINNKTCVSYNNKPTIGIFYKRYYNGGVERVISLQIKLFIKLGYNIVLFTEEIKEEKEYNLPNSVKRVQLPISYMQNRADVFKSAIKTYNISILCHHGTSSKRLIFDIILLRETGVHIILTAHELTSYYFAQNKKYLFDRVTIYKIADILLTLSSSERLFYQTCGVNTLYIPNPIANIDRSNITPVLQREPIVLWVGRISKEKNYKEALKIFKILVNKNNNITCHIVGSGSIKNNIYVRLFIYFNKLNKKIIYTPYTKDIDCFYKKASVLLVTSSFESFPMVVVEGKLYGLPLVTYELPTVEILKDNRGYVCIERHNIKEAADAVLKILEDKEYANCLSHEARESIEPFLHFYFEKKWSEILNNPSMQYSKVEKIDSNNMCLFWKTLLSMYHEGLISRPDFKEQFKEFIIDFKPVIKKLLTYLLPINSRRRNIVLNIYHSIKSLFI